MRPPVSIVFFVLATIVSCADAQGTDAQKPTSGSAMSQAGSRNLQIGIVNGNVTVQQQSHPAKAVLWIGTAHYDEPAKRPLIPKSGAGLSMKLTTTSSRLSGEVYHMAGNWDAPVNGTKSGKSVTLTETFKFAPDYIKHTWVYKGVLDEDGETITGTWRGDMDGDAGAFEIHRMKEVPQ